MKLLNRLILLAGLAALFAAFSARATPIQVAYGPVDTQPGNNGIATVTQWATDAITTYNSNNYPGAPLPALGNLIYRATPSGVTDGTAPAGWPMSFGANTSSITLPLGGFLYVVLSWGGSTLPNDNGTADYLYYIGNTTGNFTFTRPDGATGGLSGITLFGQASNTPDGGATVGLLGLGLVAVVMLRRKFSFV